MRQVARPLEEFLQREASGGFALLAAAAAGLVWANVAGASYDAVWELEISVSLGGVELGESLRLWVNDLLMALFFYLVTLEVKRELLHGRLQEWRRAAVPMAAAAGGMVVPVALYLAVTVAGDGPAEGWAIPIATDIAFALAVLAVLGQRAPDPLRAFLLTLAIVDDIGTIVVIAVFYSGGLSLAWLGVAAAVVAAVFGLQRVHIRVLPPYVLAAAVLWIALHESGVHATIAGVIVALLTPASPFHEREPTGEVISKQLGSISGSDDDELSEQTMQEAARLAEESVSPLARMEHQLHPWVSYMVLPAFALANAGVDLSGAALVAAVTGPLGLAILAGRVIGKPVGVVLASALAVRVGGAKLPPHVDWRALGALGPAAGIGFTVAIFISQLAFSDPALLEQAKLAIMIGSIVSGTAAIGAFLARHRAEAQSA